MIPLLRVCTAVLLSLAVTPVSGSESAPIQYVLLRDAAVLRGSVQEEPGRVIIRQRQGSEIRVPRERVACWADSLSGLYRYQIEQRTKATLETHLDLARWCIRNEYFSGAAREIVAAHRVHPGHESILRLERELQLAAQVAAQNAARSAAPETIAESVTAAAPPAGHPAAPPPESMQFRQFTSAIQPLLINQCAAAGCHGNGSEAVFTLAAPLEGYGRPDARMTQENLEAVVRWIDAARPDVSPLLVRSKEPHGDSEEPPLGPRHLEAQHNLRRWIHALAAGDAPSASPAFPEVAGEDGPSVAAGNLPAGQPGAPVRLPHIADPFDPELFNRSLR